MTKPRILIVDNESSITFLIKEILSNNGYSVIDVALTGEEAVKAVSKNQPDLILMDISLRDELDGITVYEQIKKTVNIPVIFVSGHVDEYMLARASLSKPSGFISKPFKSAQLIKEVEKALNWGEFTSSGGPEDLEKSRL